VGDFVLLAPSSGKNAGQSRRGGMVDATDLKSVEGQPSWGFESPRRHLYIIRIARDYLTK
jgi:hypothetical protein